MLRLAPSRSRALAALPLLVRMSGAAALSIAPRAWAAPPAPKDRLVVVAPHPDDEVLMAGGTISVARARGETVDVVVLTNGDFDCQADGVRREAESLRGLARLGVDERHVHFLGYPDGFLSKLGQSPLPPVRRLIGGHCVLGRTTYGAHGAGHADVHTATTGRPAIYTAPALLADLRGLLAAAAPTTVIVSHPQDTHPDHAKAYAFVREALAVLPRAPSLWRAVVHNDDCWPTGVAAGGDCPPGEIDPDEALPPLSGRLTGAEPDVHVPLPPAFLSRDPAVNPKLGAIFAYTSQVHDDPRSYLVSFARREEPFFSEILRREGRGPWHTLGDGAPGTSASRDTVFVEVPANAEAPVLVRLRAVGVEQGYSLSIDRAAGEARLQRKRHGEAPVTLQIWVLPHDTWSAGSASFTFAFAGKPEAPLVFTLWTGPNGRTLIGQAVDPRPLPFSPEHERVGLQEGPTPPPAISRASAGVGPRPLAP